MISKQYKFELREEILKQGNDKELQRLSRTWIETANLRKYTSHFEWLGLPITQYPQDMIAMQEIIWEVKPDLIIRTGVDAGSLIFSATMLELIAACGGGGGGEVFGIDMKLRPNDRKAIEEHPMFKHISIIQGSSIASDSIAQATEKTKGKERILIILDSNYTRDHVLAELEAYAPLTTVGSYCVVMYTIIEDMAEGFFQNRTWRRGDNPKMAVWEYLKAHPEFEIDKNIQHKLLITVAPDGYLKRLR